MKHRRWHLKYLSGWLIIILKAEFAGSLPCFLELANNGFDYFTLNYEIHSNSVNWRSSFASFGGDSAKLRKDDYAKKTPKKSFVIDSILD